MSAPIEAVTLDAAGTLIEVVRPVGESYAALAREQGATLDADALSTAFREVFRGMPPMAFGDLVRGELHGAERDWWRTLVREVTDRAGGVADFDAYFDRLYAYYASADAWRVYPEVPDVLDRLIRRGMLVAVVSNFDSRLPALLDALGLRERVHVVIHSTAAGAAKPDARIFRCALDALGAHAARTLHVGDSHSADYHGALAADLQAVHVVRAGRAPRPDTATIADLDALDDILDARRTAD